MQAIVAIMSRLGVLLPVRIIRVGLWQDYMHTEGGHASQVKQMLCMTLLICRQ